MTRWARPGNKQNLPHQASTWKELTKRITKKDFNKNEKVKEIEGKDDPILIARELAAKKDKRREHRRIKRERKRENSKTCFHCRMPGHGMADCPILKDDMEQSTNICFKCGSSEHLARVCTAKVPKGKLLFAKCFVCGQKGHLSSTCPDNPRGLYPNGGCCPLCASVEHYKRDCPERDVKDEVAVYERVQHVHVSLDEELSLYEDMDEAVERKKLEKPKKRNVVFF